MPTRTWGERGWWTQEGMRVGWRGHSNRARPALRAVVGNAVPRISNAEHLPTSLLPASCHFCVSQLGSQLELSRRARLPLLRASMIRPAGRGAGCGGEEQHGPAAVALHIVGPAPHPSPPVLAHGAPAWPPGPNQTITCCSHCTHLEPSPSCRSGARCAPWPPPPAERTPCRQSPGDRQGRGWQSSEGGSSGQQQFVEGLCYRNAAPD